MRGFLSVCLLLALAGAAHAQGQAALDRDEYVSICRPTPPITNGFYPGDVHIMRYNNLLQPAGKSAAAEGQKVILTGRVFDQRCIPLSGAKVDIWQADTHGQYRFADAGSLSNPYPVFAGSGRAVTDNNGQFTFTTVYPGAAGGAAPQIAFRIVHPRTSELFTVMYFDAESRNDRDPSYHAQPSDLRPLNVGHAEPEGDGLHVHYDITVGGSDGFRQF